MQFYDVIQNRKSIRKFKNTKLCKDKIQRMINAAMMSPSWRNHTSYKFILVEDKNKLEKLANTIINSTGDAANSVREAPMTAVIVADPNASGNIDDREYYLVDSAIAMEHFVLSATAEGYGTCWIASINEDDIRNILSIPNNYRVVAMTPVGEIKEDKPHNEKKDVKDFVFLDTWNNAYQEERELVMH